MKHIFYYTTILLIFLFSCKKDTCKDIHCDNGGICKDGLCECKNPFSGANCRDWQGQKFLGTYTPSYSCNSSTLNIAIEAKPDDQKYLTIRNLGDYSCPDGSYLVVAKIAHDSLIIEKQNTCSIKPYQFEGLGILQNGTISLHFIATYDANPGTHIDSCTVTLVKK